MDKTIFNCTNIGPNTVILTVTDRNGNSANGIAVVTVQDNTKPVVATKSASIQLDANGVASISASQVDNGSTDNCTIGSITVFPNSFTCANLGANVVILTVTDMNGNMASKTATVTVNDLIAPVVHTKDIVVHLN